MALRPGAADAAKHKIYVWDLSQEGVLHEALEGGREPLVDVQVRARHHKTLDVSDDSAVAPKQTRDGLHHEPRQHPDLALPHA